MDQALFFPTWNTLKRPIFTQLLVCSDEPLWISKRRPFLARREHGVLSVKWNLPVYRFRIVLQLSED
jgi:hypothetical protein